MLALVTKNLVRNKVTENLRVLKKR